MKRSKILDGFISEKTRLEVRALNPDRRPLSLEAVLVDYDRHGYLFSGNRPGGQTEYFYYIPRIAIGFLSFNSQLQSQRRATSIPDSTSSDASENKTYSFLDASYSPETREIKRKGQTALIEGDKEDLALKLLFEFSAKNFVPIENFIKIYGHQVNDKEKAATRSMMNRLRHKLDGFNLTVYSCRKRGYRLKEK